MRGVREWGGKGQEGSEDIAKEETNNKEEEAKKVLEEERANMDNKYKEAIQKIYPDHLR